MLTKEIFCAYLPFDLKIASPKMKSGLRSTMILRPRHLNDNGTLVDSLYKPLLRPLSSTTKELRQKLSHNANYQLAIKPYQPELRFDFHYSDMKILLAEFYDIFGLLESGHAIELKEVDNG